MSARTRRPKSASMAREPSAKERKHLDELLDEGLKETFPASDPLAILEPVHRRPRLRRSTSVREQIPMSIWLVRAAWNEDETESREEWEVSADTVQEAVKEVTARIRFPPHHIEAKLHPRSAFMDMRPGEVRRVAPR